MIVRVIILWVIGLLTIVPAALYSLFFLAGRDQYAFLITITLFWIFGFWGVLAPLLAALKVRQIMRAIERMRSKEQLLAILKSPETYELAIDLIASENRIPRFLARRIFRLLLQKFADHGADRPPPAP